MQNLLLLDCLSIPFFFTILETQSTKQHSRYYCLENGNLSFLWITESGHFVHSQLTLWYLRFCSAFCCEKLCFVHHGATGHSNFSVLCVDLHAMNGRENNFLNAVLKALLQRFILFCILCQNSPGAHWSQPHAGSQNAKFCAFVSILSLTVCADLCRFKSTQCLPKCKSIFADIVSHRGTPHVFCELVLHSSAWNQTYSKTVSSTFHRVPCREQTAQYWMQETVVFSRNLLRWNHLIGKAQQSWSHEMKRREPKQTHIHTCWQFYRVNSFHLQKCFIKTK